MTINRILLGILNRIAVLFPDKLFLKLKFRLMMREKLDLNCPKTFNQKLQWLKLYNRKPEYTNMVDKYAVKEYVANIIGEEHIIPTLGVWNSVDEIDWDVLPNQFVLKTTHGGGGGGVVICKNKANFDRDAACQILKKSMKDNIYITQREWPYKNVQKRIIAEEYMIDESGYELKDYKFFCFNGKVECFKVDFDRFTSHKANYYNRDATLLPFWETVCPADHSKTFDKPKNFNKMIEYVETLSKDIPFVRIDFYNINGKIYFGEITFFPAAGFGKFEPKEWDMILGNYLSLPVERNI